MKDDTISRQAALDALPKKQKGIGGESWMKTYRRSGYNDCVEDCMKALQALPPAQPTALTAEDIETIRIHLSAFKETLGNQGRWKEAAEYERLIQRLTGGVETG